MYLFLYLNVKKSLFRVEQTLCCLYIFNVDIKIKLPKSPSLSITNNLICKERKKRSKAFTPYMLICSNSLAGSVELI